MPVELSHLPESIDLRTSEAVGSQMAEASLQMQQEAVEQKTDIVENVRKYWFETVPGAMMPHQEPRPDGYYAPVENDYLGTTWDARGILAAGVLFGSPSGKKGMLLGAAPAALSVIEGESMRKNPYEFGTIHNAVTGVTDVATYSLTSGAWNFGQDAAETMGIKRGSVDSMFVSAGSVGLAAWTTMMTVFKWVPALKNKLWPDKDTRVQKTGTFSNREVKKLSNAFKQKNLGGLQKKLKSKGLLSLLGLGVLTKHLSGKDGKQLRDLNLGNAFEKTEAAFNKDNPDIGTVRKQAIEDLHALIQGKTLQRAGALQTSLRNLQVSTPAVNSFASLIRTIRTGEGNEKLAFSFDIGGSSLHVDDIARRHFVRDLRGPRTITQYNIMSKLASGMKFKGKVNGKTKTIRLSMLDGKFEVKVGSRPAETVKNVMQNSGSSASSNLTS